MKSFEYTVKDELGIHAREDQLQFIGTHRGQFEAEFHGKPFRDGDFFMRFFGVIT